MAKTYYDELGVRPAASAAEIKRKYRELARETHPDAQNGSDGAFVQLQAAYEVLSDPEKRKGYDAELAAAAKAAATPKPPARTKPAAPISTPRRGFRPTVFQVTVIILMAFIAILLIRILSSWSGGIGATPSPAITPEATTSTTPTPTPTPTDTPLPTETPTPTPTDTPSATPTPTGEGVLPFVSNSPSPTP